MHLELSFLLQLFQALKDVIYGNITFGFAGFEEVLNLVGEIRNKVFYPVFHRSTRRLSQL